MSMTSQEFRAIWTSTGKFMHVPNNINSWMCLCQIYSRYLISSKWKLPSILSWLQSASVAKSPQNYVDSKWFKCDNFYRFPSMSHLPSATSLASSNPKARHMICIWFTHAHQNFQRATPSHPLPTAAFFTGGARKLTRSSRRWCPWTSLPWWLPFCIVFY